MSLTEGRTSEIMDYPRVPVAEAFSRMDPTNVRLRYLVSIFFAAVVTAALLRHAVHVYAGYSREEIRTMALVAAGAGVLLTAIFFRIRKR